MLGCLDDDRERGRKSFIVEDSGSRKLSSDVLGAEEESKFRSLSSLSEVADTGVLEKFPGFAGNPGIVSKTWEIFEIFQLDFFLGFLWLQQHFLAALFPNHPKCLLLLEQTNIPSGSETA